jgi:hypothetical protein
MHDWVFERFVMAITSSPVGAQIQFPDGLEAGVAADGETIVVVPQIMVTGALILGVMYAYVWVCMAYAVNCY